MWHLFSVLLMAVLLAGRGGPRRFIEDGDATAGDTILADGVSTIEGAAALASCSR